MSPLESKLRHYQWPDIDGLELSIHALARMMERKIQEPWVRAAIKKPCRTTWTEVCEHQGSHATVFINHLNNRIVTVSYGTDNSVKAWRDGLPTLGTRR